MIFHHMMITVSDMDKALALWRDVMGFKVNADMVIPDGPEPGPTTVMYPGLTDAIYHCKDASARVVLLTSPDGAMLEIQTPINPPLTVTPPDNLKYGFTGVRELGLMVRDIDTWFEKITAAGYETQTDHVWSAANLGRSFLFYDFDGNMIQLWEHYDRVTPTWVP